MCWMKVFAEEGASPACRRGLEEPSLQGQELRVSRALLLISVVMVLSKVVSRVLEGGAGNKPKVKSHVIFNRQN